MRTASTGMPYVRRCAQRETRAHRSGLVELCTVTRWPVDGFRPIQGMSVRSELNLSEFNRTV